MGYRVESEMFEGVTYCHKSSEELRQAMTKKISEVKALTAVRLERLEKLRTDYELDGERLANLIMRFQNKNSRSGMVNFNIQGQEEGDERLIPAGVIANIVRENEMVDNERDQVRKLELVLRNLRDTEPYLEPMTGELRMRPCVHELTDAELVYLNF